ncbi:hypothetical protein D3C72_1809110 [compost metagenome]
MQDADAEGGRLAAARFRLGDQVAAIEYRRQALRLDGGHLVVAERIQVGQKGGRQRQAGKRSGGGCGVHKGGAGKKRVDGHSLQALYALVRMVVEAGGKRPPAWCLQVLPIQRCEPLSYDTHCGSLTWIDRRLAPWML